MTEADTDGKVAAYSLIGMVLLLPYIYTVCVMIKWFRYDGPETRLELPKAFCVALVMQLTRGLWAVFGSLMIFGKLLPIYLLDTFPEHYEAELAAGTRTKLQAHLSSYFLGTTITYMAVTIPMTFYFMGISKRLKPFW